MVPRPIAPYVVPRPCPRWCSTRPRTGGRRGRGTRASGGGGAGDGDRLTAREPGVGRAEEGDYRGRLVGLLEATERDHVAHPLVDGAAGLRRGARQARVGRRVARVDAE